MGVKEDCDRTKDSYQTARKLGYSSVVAMRVNDLWYRGTMVERGFNLCDVRRLEHNSDPKTRKGASVKMPKDIRGERGLGPCLSIVNCAGDQGGRRELPQCAAQRLKGKV